MLKIRRVHEEKIVVSCKYCFQDAEYSIDSFINSINLGLWFCCPHCKKRFILTVGLLDRPPEQRNEAEAGIPAASEKCPHCDCSPCIGEFDASDC